MCCVIGITCSTSESGTENTIGTSYISAIENAGGTPVIIPNVQDILCITDFLGMIDGLLLSGGVDADPSFYGEEPQSALGRIDSDRDCVEMALTTRALEMNLPILGICRGIQMLNVAAGGTLYQDIYTNRINVLKHRQSAPGSHGTHVINVKEETRLFDILKHSEIRVNSFHHQAVKRVAPNFIVSAAASDDIVEGIECARYNFVIGVQFHPELMWQNNPPITALFNEFVKAAKAYKQQKQ